ncbi:MAG: DUF4258 domain-containing protein [Nitrospirae bacterium]|nr:DUF4258 domain-containing protein [Nitrospirota bacterium]
MKLFLTQHARLRCRKRGISEEMIREAPTQPDRRGHGYQDRTLAYREFGNRVLKVVYVEENDGRVIITAMWGEA